MYADGELRSAVRDEVDGEFAAVLVRAVGAPAQGAVFVEYVDPAAAVGSLVAGLSVTASALDASAFVASALAASVRSGATSGVVG